MRTRKLAALASTVALLGLAGTAFGQTPAQEQYNGGGGAGGGGSVGGDLERPTEASVAGEVGGGALPFTGFQAAAVLLGGAGIAATGLALRRIGRPPKS